MDKAKAAMASTGIAVVVEGYTDVIALHEAGVRNAVATLGTALTMRHIRLLSRHAQHAIVYLFDGDEAGQRAADRALAFIDDSMTPEAGKSRIELAAVTLPDNLDPDGFEQAAAPQRPARSLPRAEVNRRRFERQLLTLAARRPDLALLHADALAQTQWHEQAHAVVAQSMLDALAEDTAASSARLVTEASRALPAAAAVLTSGTVSETAAPEQLAAFLVEELAIGDAEDAVGALRAQIADPSRLDPDELEMLYETVAAMQQDLKRRRAAHKPLSPRS